MLVANDTLPEWADMTSVERIERIKAVWQQGMSASSLSLYFRGASRNAIIGMFHRHADNLGECRLRPRMKGRRRSSRKKKMQDSEILPPPACRHVPMGKLEARECKWAVNDAARGEGHLFCGAHVEHRGPYCAYHEALAWRPSGKVNDYGMAA